LDELGAPPSLVSESALHFPGTGKLMGMFRAPPPENIARTNSSEEKWTLVAARINHLIQMLLTIRSRKKVAHKFDPPKREINEHIMKFS
jgi:hypothetical protein